MKIPFGAPGAPPKWSQGAKSGVGTSATGASRVWFTLASGIVTEVYYPTVDTANTRDLQFLVTGPGFFDEESRDTSHAVEYLDPDSLAYRITNTAKNGKYRITKKVVTDPEGQSLVVRASFTPLEGSVDDYRVYVLLAPHVKNMGYGNTGRVASYRGKTFFTAWREDVSLALTADVSITKASVGYVGSSDGWQDLSNGGGLDWEFDCAPEGNIAFTGELDLSRAGEFTVVLSFSSSPTTAITEALATLGRSYRTVEREYIKGWSRYLSGLKDLSGASLDRGRLYRISAMVMKAHQDKAHGGVIASLSVPWGDAKGDGESGGYHLVWPRDLVNTAFAFMAAGDVASPVRILRYLAGTQKPDGSWPQNMWMDGRPYWKAVQLDEVALPVVLAWRLKRAGALVDDYYLMAKRAAGFILRHGPVTEQDRWEEHTGFSPATLAALVAALISASEWAGLEGEHREAGYLMEVADYWSSRIEDWTFSECDCLGTGEPGHFMRIVADPPESLPPGSELCHAEIFLKNSPYYRLHHQGEVIDAGFLELARFGVRRANDFHITSSLTFVDRLLRTDLGGGPLFYRYNGDGYGEGPDGEPFGGAGIGRPWPLLSGERGVFEAEAGRDPDPYLRAMEGSAGPGGMLPEQVWDSEDLPEKGLFKGRGTGSATPLVWAHAQYIRLLRTKAYRSGCDVLCEVEERYAATGRPERRLTVWKAEKPVRYAPSELALRVAAPEPATLVWSADGWATKKEAPLAPTGLGVWRLDFSPGEFATGTLLTFTFRYEGDRWEGADFRVEMT